MHSYVSRYMASTAFLATEGYAVALLDLEPLVRIFVRLTRFRAVRRTRTR